MSVIWWGLIGGVIYGVIIFVVFRFMRGARGPQRYGNSDLW